MSLLNKSIFVKQTDKLINFQKKNFWNEKKKLIIKSF